MRKLCKRCGTYERYSSGNCKKCSKARASAAYRNNRDSVLADLRKQYAEDPSVFKEKMLLRRFGMTLEDYADLLEAQGGVCATCGSDDPHGRGRFHVDHCHKTGRVRGLLCHFCNVGIGSLRDDPELVVKALLYLKRS